MDDLIILSYLLVYVRWITGIILLTAGAAKMQDTHEFVSTIQSFRIVPRRLSKSMAYLVISLELILGVALIMGVGVKLATGVASLLFVGFTATILVNLVRHNILDCNCFGPYLKEKISAKAVIRNLVFILFCLLVWQLYDGYLALEPWLFGKTGIQSHPFEPFFLLTGGIVLFGVSILSARKILENFKSVTSSSLN